ncbi:VOC family protein [Streptomyces sp. NPDC005438]|uniref:VOC family protein n=1 Tax=Streptomyces sp. NPDC005438 TaxID=3156880 RepID=UPI0033BEA2FE
MIVSLDHVQLAVPAGSEDRLRAYYGRLLGMTEVPKPPELAARGGCWFTAGPVSLHLGVEADFRPAGKAHPGLRVRDLTALARRLEGAGYRVRWDEALPHERRFHTHDPVGNRLEFLQYEPDSRDTGGS